MEIMLYSSLFIVFLIFFIVVFIVVFYSPIFLLLATLQSMLLTVFQSTASMVFFRSMLHLVSLEIV